MADFSLSPVFTSSEVSLILVWCCWNWSQWAPSNQTCGVIAHLIRQPCSKPWSLPFEGWFIFLCCAQERRDCRVIWEVNYSCPPTPLVHRHFSLGTLQKMRVGVRVVSQCGIQRDQGLYPHPLLSSLNTDLMASLSYLKCTTNSTKLSASHPSGSCFCFAPWPHLSDDRFMEKLPGNWKIV